MGPEGRSEGPRSWQRHILQPETILYRFSDEGQTGFSVTALQGQWDNWSFLRIRNSAVQHHNFDGAVNPQYPALLRPIRTRGDWGKDPRQDRSLQAQRHVDGWHHSRESTREKSSHQTARSATQSGLQRSLAPIPRKSSK